MSYPIIGDSTVLHSPPVKNKRGPVAQLGARTVRIRKVEGSIPFGSTRWTLHEHLLFQRRLRRKGVAVMSKQKLRVKVLMCLDPRFFIFCTLVRPFIKPLRISNMMSCSQDTLSDFPISCNLAGNRVLAHGTMHLVHCFKKHDSIK